MKTFRRIIIAVLVVWVSVVFVADPGINGWKPMRFTDMIYSTTYRPFVFRLLVPFSIRTIASVIPDGVRPTLVQSLPNLGLKNDPPWDKEQLPEYYVALLVIIGSLFAYTLALRYLCSGLYRVSSGALDWIVIVQLLILPFFFRYRSYLYDFASLFFFTMGLALMLRQKWGWYLLLFPFACLNKETTILQTLVFAIHFWPLTGRMKVPLYGKLLFAQLLMFGAIKVWLSYAFRFNGGTLTHWHLFDHNIPLVAYHWFWVLLSCVALFALLAHRWSEKPIFLRHSLVVLPIVVGLAFFLGYLDEIRAFYEALPIVLLLIVPSIAAFFLFPLPVRTQLSFTESETQL